MTKTRHRETDKQSFIAVAATLWVCCAIVAGPVIALFFGWQAGVGGLIAASVVVALILA